MTLSGLRGRTQRKDTLSALFEIHEKEKAVDLTKRGFTQRGDSSGLIRFSFDSQLFRFLPVLRTVRGPHKDGGDNAKKRGPDLTARRGPL